MDLGLNGSLGIVKYVLVWRTEEQIHLGGYPFGDSSLFPSNGSMRGDSPNGAMATLGTALHAGYLYQSIPLPWNNHFLGGRKSLLRVTCYVCEGLCFNTEVKYVGWWLWVATTDPLSMVTRESFGVAMSNPRRDRN